MKRVVVRRGSVAGRRWTLTALLPPGFPIVPEDRRAACYRLSFKGERSHGFGCDERTGCTRVAGTIFVFGELPARVKRVRVTGAGIAETGRAKGYPLASFDRPDDRRFARRPAPLPPPLESPPDAGPSRSHGRGPIRADGGA